MTQEFKVGDRDPYIAKIQRMLNEKQNLHLKTDGGFGNITRDAIVAYQTKHGLKPTGTYSPQLASVLDPLIEFKYLTYSDFKTAAGILEVPVPVIQAVQNVESTGEGFFEDGRAGILFERHHFRRHLMTWMGLSINNVITVAKAAGLSFNPATVNVNFVDSALILKMGDIYNSVPGGYSGGVKEYDRLNKAATLNQTCALQAASWGLFQIMGSYYNLMGYATVQDMVAAAQTSEDLQLQMFCKFVKADNRTWRALVAKDWRTFAIAYNGVNQAQNNYSVKIAQSVAQFTAIA